jgi:hypothetical protein
MSATIDKAVSDTIDKPRDVPHEERQEEERWHRWEAVAAARYRSSRHSHRLAWAAADRRHRRRRRAMEAAVKGRLHRRRRALAAAADGHHRRPCRQQQR